MPSAVCTSHMTSFFFCGKRIQERILASWNRTIYCNAHAQHHDLEISWWRQFKWIFHLKIVLFEESRSVLPFQNNLTILCQRKTVKNFEEPDNCDPVLLCTSTDMETIWAWCMVLISRHGQCGNKRKKRHPDFVL